MQKAVEKSSYNIFKQFALLQMFLKERLVTKKRLHYFKYK